MGMGGGMALEDAVVLGQCVTAAATREEALKAFMARRYDRVRTVVQTSVTLSRLELERAPPAENRAAAGAAFKVLAEPY
jgi:2-polyprenyl-6-methoxyphenol hydroxylase-like FAD-dependent oxidoreductase